MSLLVMCDICYDLCNTFELINDAVARLCGVHCLNTLLQGSYFTEVDLAQVALVCTSKANPPSHSHSPTHHSPLTHSHPLIYSYHSFLTPRIHVLGITSLTRYYVFCPYFLHTVVYHSKKKRITPTTPQF